ncbi:MAG TPA: UDP-N-acetylmuramoyl-tripeptide--D-alanyl-D-alanine ligase [Rhabdochlamydiaceae bacterium]|nr:UDP-N-acetylmuramoyl-tripeptide--D-alanyl-D-alanine ligase [Rhabdochlamydiaceae bacterium]
MKGQSLAKWAKLLKIDEPNDSPVIAVEVDSRKVKRGALFFALKGEKFDGHDYLKEVAEKGAVGAIVSKKFQGEISGFPLLRVDDVVEALHLFAKEEINQHHCKIVGVTGSVGKTTTKEFIAKLLEGKFCVAKTPGNANSQVGFPLSLLNQDAEEEVLVAEMGMSHQGEITKLVDIAPPDVAVITKVALAHSEFFLDGLDGIAAAKAEILAHPKTGFAIINASAAQFECVMNNGSCKKKVYGVGDESDQSDWKLRIFPDGLRLEDGKSFSPLFSLPFKASHLCENFLAAAAVARHFGLSWEEIIVRAQMLRGYKMRFEVIERNGIVIINDSYNANPTSMRAALSNLPKPEKGCQTIAVIGEMKELGKFSEKSHREIGQFALECVDRLLCYGKGCSPMMEIFSEANRPAEFFHALNDLKERLFQIAKPGDVVLLKGSNGNKLWRIIDEEDLH